MAWGNVHLKSCSSKMILSLPSSTEIEALPIVVNTKGTLPTPAEAEQALEDG